MKNFLSKLSFYIDGFTMRLGNGVSWLTLVLVILICVDVVMRYLFSNTKTWVLELEWHVFSILFLIGASYTLLYDKHVRVDLFYERMSQNRKNWVNIFGVVLFLVPWCLIIIYYGWDYAVNSFSFHEGSPNPNGLPFRYVIKSFIFIGFVLLLLQGISELIRAAVRNRND